MTTIATCSNPAEAMLLKSLLEANDITAYVPEELTAQSAPHFSGSGIRIQVDDQHADASEDGLNERDAQHALSHATHGGDGKRGETDARRP